VNVSTRKAVFGWLLVVAGVVALVLSVRGWQSGNMALLGGACLLRAGWEIGRNWLNLEPERQDHQ
jgi:hypothetical protein